MGFQRETKRKTSENAITRHSTPCQNIWVICEMLKLKTHQIELNNFLELIPVEPRIFNYVIETGSNSIAKCIEGLKLSEIAEVSSTWAFGWPIINCSKLYQLNLIFEQILILLSNFDHFFLLSTDPDWPHRQCVGLAFRRSSVRFPVAAASLAICSPYFHRAIRGAQGVLPRGGMHKSSCGRLSKRRSNSPRRVLGLAVSVPI